jgi:LysM repeat protein
MKNLTLIYVLMGHLLIIWALFLSSGVDEGKAVSQAMPTKSAGQMIEQTPGNKSLTRGPKTSSPSSVNRHKIMPIKKKFVNYIVQPGDYLSTIARKFKTSVNKIKAANHLKNDRIYSHQKLTIPQD